MNYEIIPTTDEEILEIMETLNLPDFDYTALGVEPEEIDEKQLKQDGSKEVAVHAKAIKYDLGDESPIFLFFECHAKYKNILHVGGKVFSAKNLTWGYGKIAWRAGSGWPLYTVPCPPKHNWPRHRPRAILGRAGFTPCKTPFSGKVNKATRVIFDVEDDHYSDNTGTFAVIITSFSA